MSPTARETLTEAKLQLKEHRAKTTALLAVVDALEMAERDVRRAGENAKGTAADISVAVATCLEAIADAAARCWEMRP